MNRLAKDEPCFVSAEVCIEFFVILVQTRGHVEVYRNWGNRAFDSGSAFRETLENLEGLSSRNSWIMKSVHLTLFLARTCFWFNEALGGGKRRECITYVQLCT